MSISAVSEGQILKILQRLGVKPGDGLLVHSALQFLGRPESGPQLYLRALQRAVGPRGTLAVPTFNFAFARGQDFDPATAPAEGMGVLSELVRRDSAARRTNHPLQSLALIGMRAGELAELDTPGAFDDGSPFDRMLQLGFKLLLLGAKVQAASIVHYSEQRAQVPYRFRKEFTGRVRKDGKWTTATYAMYARDLALDPRLRLAPIREALEAEGKWLSQPLNFGHIAVCLLSDFVNATDRILAADPWALVANPPPREVLPD